MTPPDHEDICTKCGAWLELVCDPTGQYSYPHCFNCDQRVTADQALEQVIRHREQVFEEERRYLASRPSLRLAQDDSRLATLKQIAELQLEISRMRTALIDVAGTIHLDPDYAYGVATRALQPPNITQPNPTPTS